MAQLNKERIAKVTHIVDSVCLCASMCVVLPTWWCHHPLPFLEEAGLEAVSGAEAVCLVSGHQLLHGLQNHTQLVERAEKWGMLEIKHSQKSLEIALLATSTLSLYHLTHDLYGAHVVEPLQLKVNIGRSDKLHRSHDSYMCLRHLQDKKN